MNKDHTTDKLINARCPNGTRRNKRTGECVKKRSLPRCPNGSRRNKTTGECDKKMKQKSDDPSPIKIPMTYLIFHSKSKEINKFGLPKHAMRRLSNFSDDTVLFDGHIYPTVEHAYQGQKYVCSNKPELVKMFYDGTLSTAIEAKSAGGKGGMKKHGAVLNFQCWTKEKSDRIMKQLVESKIERSSDVRNILHILKTNNVKLVHFSRSDMYWGAHMNDDATEIKKGENKLGEIYNNYNL